VSSCRDQLNWRTTYDPTYTKLKFPNGDVPKDKGVCTDVLVRAFRSAGYDLQSLIHKHKSANVNQYPNRKIDPNIDHRRVQDQMAFFKAKGKTLSNELQSADWQPGDIVCWILPSGRDHTGLLSDRGGSSGNLMVFHNMSIPKEEDCLGSFRIVAHFRYPK
jgi:uncharacterized protein YijF (DUF1287 family)